MSVQLMQALAQAPDIAATDGSGDRSAMKTLCRAKPLDPCSLIGRRRARLLTSRAGKLCLESKRVIPGTPQCAHSRAPTGC
ncbi:hypothetical protein JYU34_019680 [Plutella xylostella]|uniref:Uncharacterized protein n=1 Tax=Plutella xylostella TaxID=51655 RepID=A0ABQ7PWG0_PLUXY|nr:hypothetical protein JYU34_019680 [Plutella xylostella]